MSNSFEDDSDNFEVTPWKVEGSVDYARLIKKFGTQEITDEILEKIQAFTGQLHPLLEHRFFFSHRDLDWILNKYEKDEKFYLYTGRGPSGMVHLGHLMPWFLTKHLQDKFDSNLLFQITDDEKFLFGNKTMDEINKNVYENILDIIAIGFKKSRTKIIVNSRHIKHLYSNSLEIAKRITFSTAKSIFGFTNSTNVGMIGFPPLQAVPCFLPTIIEGKPTPVLIPAAIDQDPYWRLTRDIAEKIGFYKPAQIHSKFLPSLQTTGKMSSSNPETALFTTDEPKIIEEKVSNAFTGGQPTTALQKKLGGNPEICSVFSYLKFLFDTSRESNQRELKCRSGNLLCGECKHDLSNHSTAFISMFQEQRQKAIDLVPDYMYSEDS
ncbi:MAG TPA: tryptophan--tRNA ligase [Nitrososphaeraceae archaeon]|jgi:tryptophanyl-tRNA synthetase